MAKESIQEEIMEVIRESTETEVDFDMDTLLIEDMGLASIEVMVLLNDLESEFDVDFEPDDLLQVRCIGDLVKLVEDQL